jgi:hypothetical protein
LTGEGGVLQQLTKRLLQSALEGEITDHLGYDKPRSPTWTSVYISDWATSSTSVTTRLTCPDGFSAGAGCHSG